MLLPTLLRETSQHKNHRTGKPPLLNAPSGAGLGLGREAHCCHIWDNRALLWLYHRPIAGAASQRLSPMKEADPPRGRSYFVRVGAASLASLSPFRLGPNEHSFASRSEANLSHVLARSDHIFLASRLVAVCASRTQSSACWRHSLGSRGMRLVAPLQKKPRPRWIV